MKVARTFQISAEHSFIGVFRLFYCMPYRLQQSGGGYTVVNSETGRKHSKRPLPRKRAVAQMRALYAAENKDAGPPLAGPGGLLGTVGMGGRRWGNRKKAAGCTCGVNVATKEQIAPGITRIRGNLCNVHGRYGPCDAAQSGKKKPKGRKAGAKKPAAGKKPKTLSPEAQKRQSEREADRARRLQEHEQDRAQRAQDRAQRQTEHQQDRAQRAQDRATRLAERQQQAAERRKKTAAAKKKKQPAQKKPDKAQQQAENRASVKKTMADSDQGLAPAGFDALVALGDGTEPADPQGLIDMGVAERGSDGHVRLTASGRVAINAANRGDAKGAIDAISRGHDQAAAARDRKTAADQRKQEADKRRAAADQRRQETIQRRLSQGTPGSRNPRISSRRPAVQLPNRRKGNATMRTKAADPGDYLIVEDREKPSTYHLQVKRNGTPDHRLMGAAWAALHGGYRGNKYEGPNKGDAISKLRALYKREGMPMPSEKSYWRFDPGVPTANVNSASFEYGNQSKSFTVFKSADGPYRWIARSTTAYRDREGEIITTKALETDAARMTATGQYGPLRYWHLGQPDPFNPVEPWGAGVDIGYCDYSTVIGRTSIESGTFKSAAIGKAFAESADEYELSPGFFHPATAPNAAGEYDEIRRFERSVVPIKYGRASNLFTGMTVKEQRMNPEEYERRMKAFAADMQSKGVPPEVAGSVIAGMEQADKSATDQGIAYKSDDADPWAAVTAALKSALGVAEKAPMAPASMMQAGATEMADATADQSGESPEEDTGETGEESYVGDMSPDEFRAFLIDAFGEAINQFGTGISGKMAEMDDALKTMGYARMKSEQDTTANSAEIAKLKARLAELEGNQPAVVNPADIEAALKGAPQSPPDPDRPQLPPDASPLAHLAARTMPALYNTGQDGKWTGWQPPVPQS